MRKAKGTKILGAQNPKTKKNKEIELFSDFNLH